MRLVSMLVVRNEAGRYLVEVLTQCLAISEAVVVWDDGSDDDTAQIAADMGCEVWRTDESHWATDEHLVREALYAKAMAHDPEWLYAPDADELLESPERVTGLLSGRGPYTFDMWHAWESRDAYRRDGYWKGQRGLRLFRPPVDSRFRAMTLHCGSAPESVQRAKPRPSGLRVFHLGYARPGDAVEKYARYSMLDPGGRQCPQSHYDSMLLPPHLTDKDGAPLVPATFGGVR